MGPVLSSAEKEVAKKTGVMDVGGAFLCPTDSRMFLQEMPRNLNPAGSTEKLRVGVQNVVSLKKKKKSCGEGKSISPGFLGFSGCLSSSAVLIGRPTAVGWLEGPGVRTCRKWWLVPVQRDWGGPPSGQMLGLGSRELVCSQLPAGPR